MKKERFQAVVYVVTSVLMVGLVIGIFGGCPHRCVSQEETYSLEAVSGARDLPVGSKVDYGNIVKIPLSELIARQTGGDIDEIWRTVGVTKFGINVFVDTSYYGMRRCLPSLQAEVKQTHSPSSFFCKLDTWSVQGDVVRITFCYDSGPAWFLAIVTGILGGIALHVEYRVFRRRARRVARKA